MNAFECLLEGSRALVLTSIDEADKMGEYPSLANEIKDDLLEFSTELLSNGSLETDVDSDRDEADCAELSWRLDPKRSLSDWKVVVGVLGTTFQTTYHVHKSVLAVGPRRSNFFSSAFLEQETKQAKEQQKQKFVSSPDNHLLQFTRQLKEQWDSITVGETRLVKGVDDEEAVEANISHIEVHRLAAAAFPIMLDYMYSASGYLNINTDNATALFALAQQLEIKALRRAVKEFWLRDLRMENLCTYYQHARVFKENRIILHAEEVCASEIFDVDEKIVVDILTTVDPWFFLKVVSSSRVGAGATNTSLRLSLLIAVYCNIHRTEMDKSMFLRLTAASHLPTLEIKAARALLEIEDDLSGPSERNAPSSLKTRCVAILAENWDIACIVEQPVGTLDHCNGEDEALKKFVSLPCLYGKQLENFTSLAFLHAKRSLDNASTDCTALQVRNAELERDLEEARAVIKRLSRQLAQIDPTLNDAVCTKE